MHLRENREIKTRGEDEEVFLSLFLCALRCDDIKYKILPSCVCARSKYNLAFICVRSGFYGGAHFCDVIKSAVSNWLSKINDVNHYL